MDARPLYEAASKKGEEIVSQTRPNHETVVRGASGQTYTVMNGVLYAYMGEASWSGRTRDVEAHYFLMLGKDDGEKYFRDSRAWREQLSISDSIPHELYVPLDKVTDPTSNEVSERLGKDAVFQALQNFAKDCAGLPTLFAEKLKAAREKSKKADDEAKTMLQAFK